MPEAVDGYASNTPVQEFRIYELPDPEFQSGSSESADEDELIMSLGGEEIDPNEQVADSVLEEVKQHMGDASYVNDDGTPAIGRSYPPRQIELEAEVIQDDKSLALDDRTEGNVVRLVVDSITLDDCVMRGEIQNNSVTSYARDVTITIAELDGDRSVEWHWPLTIRPGESAPFEVKIDWFPHTYSSEFPVSSDPPYPLDINNWSLFGNTFVDVEAYLSSEPDLRRAFEFNSDNTEIEVLWQNPAHKFLIYDERALELEVSQLWDLYGREYTVRTKPSFSQTFPGEVVKSKDSEPMVSEFRLYQYEDIFYVPSLLYPEIYEEGVDETVTDVRIYQVYKHGSKVIDVWELVPHSIVETVDSRGLLTDRRLAPVSEFVNYAVSDGESIYVQLLDPYQEPDNFPFRNVEGIASTHSNDWARMSYELRIGGVSHKDVSPTVDPLDTHDSSEGKSCYAPDGLLVGDFYLQGQMMVPFTETLGYWGPFTTFDSDANTVDMVRVDRDSISIDDQDIRGLLHNVSQEDFAQGVTVSATRSDTGMLLGTWHWPLTMQPGERAPFEIHYFGPNLDREEIDFHVAANFSTFPDPTRAFSISTYASGTVYGQKSKHLYNYRPFDSKYYEMRAGYALDHRGILFTPRSRYTKVEFLELYGDVSLPEDIGEYELFSFVDMYARLEPPDSHPELAKTVTTQFIHDLRAYIAILDDDMEVVDVKKIPLFTPVYGQSNVEASYVGVNTIPVPNRWSPNAVRLLRIIPYEDEAEMNAGYYYQVWIGGANDPLE